MREIVSSRRAFSSHSGHGAGASPRSASRTSTISSTLRWRGSADGRLPACAALCAASCASCERLDAFDEISHAVLSRLDFASMSVRRELCHGKAFRRILRAIPRDRSVGRRDYAMFLLMAAYGLGAGEIVGLRLDDIDWRAGVLRARRPKTAVPIELPLLPAVARALASYLQRDRSRTTSTRMLFVTMGLPQRALTGSVLRHQARTYAARAGVTVAPLGAHVFRHSHATRQIDTGAPAKVVGDILGHRRPPSISAHVRLALRRLRGVGLPVPR
jgi:integrase